MRVATQAIGARTGHVDAHAGEARTQRVSAGHACRRVADAERLRSGGWTQVHHARAAGAGLVGRHHYVVKEIVPQAKIVYTWGDGDE
jgi:uncharacterized protein YndB with AHSA1/START domain